MTKEFIQSMTDKTARMFTVALGFIGMIAIANSPNREVQQTAFLLLIICGFALLYKNIWITLFTWLTVINFAAFGFKLGSQYVIGIFSAGALYYLIKKVFKREHTDFFVNVMLWFVVVNLFYAVSQVSGFDFIYTQEIFKEGRVRLAMNTSPMGFMGFTAAFGMLMALAAPLILSRWTVTAKIAGIGLLVPVWLSQSPTNILACLAGLAFIIWFKLRRKWLFCAVLGVFIAGGAFYATKIDRFNQERFPQWRMALCDVTKSPFIGFGLDSFRQMTDLKPYTYAKVGWASKETTKEHFDILKLMRLYPVDGKAVVPDWAMADPTVMIINANKMVAVKSSFPDAEYTLMEWDNPHNLIVSLILEWGVFALVILIGFLRQSVLWFLGSSKNRNVIGIAGFFVCFFLLSMAHFPLFLSRLAVFIIPMLALYEVNVREDYA